MPAGAIVVGVDDSEAARHAAVVGERLAIGAHRSLRLVVAARDVLAELVVARVRLDTDAFHERLLQGARTRVAKSLESVLEGKRLRECLQARLGRPEKVIADFCHENPAEVVVLGGKHRSAPSTWFRSGTAHHLLRTTETPLLVTGPGALNIERVLVALDFSFAAPLAVSLGQRLARWLDARIEAVHVVDDRPFSAGLHLPFELGELTARSRERAEQELWPLLTPETTCQILVGPVAATLAGEASKGPGCLVVVGSHGLGRVNRWLLGSLAEALLAELPASVAVMPAVPADSAATRANKEAGDD